jgi:hypothetical protein
MITAPPRSGATWHAEEISTNWHHSAERNEWFAWPSTAVPRGPTIGKLRGGAMFWPDAGGHTPWREEIGVQENAASQMRHSQNVGQCIHTDFSIRSRCFGHVSRCAGHRPPPVWRPKDRWWLRVGGCGAENHRHRTNRAGGGGT